MLTSITLLLVQKGEQDIMSWDLIILTRPSSCLLGKRYCRGKLLGMQQFTLLSFFGWCGKLRNYTIFAIVLLCPSAVGLPCLGSYKSHLTWAA